MRENWTRTDEALCLSNLQLEALLQPAFPRTRVLHSQIAHGGLANTNIRVMLYDRKTPVMVRLYTRDPSQAAKEYRLNQAIDGLVPIPEFFHFSKDNRVTGHPYCVMEWLDAPRLDAVSAKLKNEEFQELAQSLGTVLAAIHNFTFPMCGFLDDHLKVSTPLNLGGSGLLAFARECLIAKNGSDRLGENETNAVFQFIERVGPLLDNERVPACLTHSDFGGSNILVHDRGLGWEVAAVLDWEFAFAGSPLMDFGNLLRKPLGERQGFADSVVESYRQHGGTLPHDWPRLIRLADFSAWLDFLSRPAINSALLADAKTTIHETMLLFP